MSLLLIGMARATPRAAIAPTENQTAVVPLGIIFNYLLIKKNTRMIYSLLVRYLFILGGQNVDFLATN